MAREISAFPLSLPAAPERGSLYRWLYRELRTAILDGRLRGSLAVSGGVHEPIDAVKAIMAGADGVQIVSALLKRGPAYLRQIVAGFQAWVAEHEYESLDQMRPQQRTRRPRTPDMGPLSTRLVFTDASQRPVARNVCQRLRARAGLQRVATSCLSWKSVPDLRQRGALRVCGRRKSGGSWGPHALLRPILLASRLLCGIPQTRGRTRRRGATMEDICFEC